MNSRVEKKRTHEEKRRCSSLSHLSLLQQPLSAWSLSTLPIQSNLYVFMNGIGGV